MSQLEETVAETAGAVVEATVAAAEEALVLGCESSEILGILHRPAADKDNHVGVVIIVGGAQYRVGSHRMFVSLGRYLAEHGITTLRFDRRGMGDSQGQDPGFDDCDDDIRAALTALKERSPGLEKLYLLGLCDGATAGVNYRFSDPNVDGYILINPWIRSAETEAQALMGHYYKRRLGEKQFWIDLFHGKINLGQSLREYLGHWKVVSADGPVFPSLETEMYHKLEKSGKSTLFLISGKDVTGQEFRSVSEKANWQRLLGSDYMDVEIYPEADHTFSSRASKAELFESCLKWLAPKAS